MAAVCFVRGQIGDRIGQALRLEGRLLTTEAASSALAAAAFLQSLTPSQVCLLSVYAYGRKVSQNQNDLCNRIMPCECSSSYVFMA